MKRAKAFSPCHITGFFQIFDQSTDLLHVGSRGAGVALSRGVETTVEAVPASKRSVAIRINGIPSNSAEVSRRVTKAMLSELLESKRFKIDVEHNVDVPIGAGMGASGAAALSLSLALNETLGLGMSKVEAAQVAHVAEVECRTGLGTVIAETFGGVEMRVRPGAPGIGEVKQIPVPEDTVVACLTFGPLSTKKLLSDKGTRTHIDEFGGKLVDMLVERPELETFLSLSRRFAEHLRLMSQNVRQVLDATNDAQFICSMPMFGESVFTLVKRGSLQKLVEIFQKHGSMGKVITSDIDFEGARVLR
jgi:pantoate kinase